MVSSGVQTRAAARYSPQPPFLDELFEVDGAPRPTAVPLVRELERLGPEGLVDAGRRRDAIFMQQGITFETSGVAGPSHERPFPLDLVPRVLNGEEWREIKRGLAQRIRALNHFVDDVYHAREIVREGIVPWRLVASCSHFARAVHGIRPPGGVYTHVAGCDLVRHSDGTWKVIEDNVRIPSGISYVLENRAAMAREPHRHPQRPGGAAADQAGGAGRRRTAARMRQDDARKALHADGEWALPPDAHSPRERQGRDLHAEKQRRGQPPRDEARLHHLQPPAAGAPRLRRSGRGRASRHERRDSAGAHALGAAIT
jgi:hypothetical protein